MDSLNHELTSEIKQMKQSFDLFKLSERLLSMERQCSTNAQYSRTECLKITSIPSAVNDSDLKNFVCRIVNKVGVATIDTYIKDYHRVGNKGQTIVKFVRENMSKKTWISKMILSKIRKEDSQMTGDNKIYINQSLCPYYCMLCRKANHYTERVRFLRIVYLMAT